MIEQAYSIVHQATPILLSIVFAASVFVLSTWFDAARSKSSASATGTPGAMTSGAPSQIVSAL